MAQSVEQFGKALAASGLMAGEDLKALWAALKPEERPRDGDGLAALLVERGKLTKFQAQELLAGRGGGLVMGDYLLLAEIGAGGMGKVYKAQHRRMKRVVALKVMSSAAMQDDAAVKRFQREVEAAARLEHPNIVTAYDSGEAGKVKYLVMQFVDGGDLSDFVKKNGALPIEAAVGYVIQAAKGLAFAHAAGVVHRDIKPANLLLDKKGVVKILDMGLARIEDGDGLTATEQVMGTVDYMSPEQAAETKNADGRSDIYSLGCTLWYLLSAKKLYDGDTMISRLMKHRDAELPSLVKTRDDATWPLEQVLHKMIAKRPQDRYQSMDEVVAALEPFAGGGSPSGGGMGSSIGFGKGQSAELASFMQAMAGGKSADGTKPAGSSASVVVKPATSTAIDATAAFSASEVGTDPKSQHHTRGLPPIGAAHAGAAKTQAKAVRKKSPPVMLIAGGLGAVALLAVLGIWVVVRDKDGNEVAKIAVPAGGSVTVQPAGSVATPIPAVPLPAAAQSPSVQSSSAIAATPAASMIRPATSGSPPPPAVFPFDAATSGSPPPPAVFPFDAATAAKHQQAWAAYLGVPVEFTNSLGMKLVLIPPGEFAMGFDPALKLELDRLKVLEFDAEQDQKTRYDFLDAATPRHSVRLAQPYYIGVEEVRVGWYRDVMGSVPPNNPADNPDAAITLNCSQREAVEFCNRLSEREKRTPSFLVAGNTTTLVADASGYRLPTEAEWEFACRAGTDAFYFFGNEPGTKGPVGPSILAQYQRARSKEQTLPNPFGLFDVYGGTNEWCWAPATRSPTRAFCPEPYAAQSGTRIDVPAAADAGTYAVKRGGSTYDGAGFDPRRVNSYSRSAVNRHTVEKYGGIGRLVLPVPVPLARSAAVSAPPAAPTTPPPGDYALELTGFENKASGAAWVDVPSLLLSEAGPLTLETRVWKVAHNEGFVLGGKALRIRLRSNTWTTWVHDDYRNQLPLVPVENRWQHLALVRTESEIRMYVDGKRTGVMPLPNPDGPQPARQSTPLQIGGNNANIRLDEVRISKSARYDQDFTPPLKHVLDADTLALYRCDEGSGDVLRDASPNKHHGKITRPGWVRPDGAPIGSVGSAPAVAAEPATPWPLDPRDGKAYAWSAPESLGAGINTGASERLAGISADGRTLWFVRAGTGLMSSRRSAAGLPFSPGQPVPGAADADDGSISADGLTWAFVKVLDHSTFIPFWSERSAPTEPFPAPQPLSAPGEPRDAHLTLSPDGLTLLTTSSRPGGARGDVWMRTRAARGSPFGAPERLPEPVSTADWDMPCFVSDDRLLVIVMNQRGDGTSKPVRNVRYHVRTDQKAPFGEGLPLGVPLGPAEGSDLNGGFRLTGDGRATYFSTSEMPDGAGQQDIWVSRRVPIAGGATLGSPAAGAMPATTPSQIERLLSADYEWSEPESLGPVVNAGQSTYSPTLSNDQLCLIVANEFGSYDKRNGLYEYRRQSITEPCSVVKQLSDSNQDFPSLDPAGLMLFTKIEGAKRADGKSNRELVVRTRSGRDAPWGPVTPLATLNTLESEDLPVISPDGLTLAFSSNRSGSLGGIDLWISHRADLQAGWETPVSLGSNVNSVKDERPVQILGDSKTILFSRDGKLFLTAPDAQGVYDLRPVPLPQNLKTYKCWLAPDGATLYFDNRYASENKEGTYEVRLIRRVPKAAAGVVYLDDLPEVEFRVFGNQGLGKHGKFRERAGVEKEILFHGKQPAHTLWMHPQPFDAPTAFARYQLDGRFATFAAEAGIPDAKVDPQSPIEFRVLGDGRELWKSPAMTKCGESAEVSVNVRGVKELRLEASRGDKNFNCHAVWFMPRLTPVDAKEADLKSAAAKADDGPPPTAPPPGDDALDRKVAQWLLAAGLPCQVLQGTKKIDLKPGSPLPAGPLTFYGINSTPKSMERAALLAGLADFKRMNQFTFTFLPQKDCDLWAEAFAAMPNIVSVNAGGCRELTDAGAGYLAKLPKLEYVNLSDSSLVTRVGLAAFEKCATLQTISVSEQCLAEGKYALADVQRLQDALPKTRVVFGGVKPIPGLKPAAVK